MFDVLRYFCFKEFVKKQIDVLVYYKFNCLYLYLIDVVGWCIEIKKYFLLIEFVVWCLEVNWKKWWNEGGCKYCCFDVLGVLGGYYIQDDICELVNYVCECYVIIIFEIEMLVYLEEVLIVYLELFCLGEFYKDVDFCVGNEKIFMFFEDVLMEVMEFFFF